MIEENEKKIILYPSNWLYNAGVVGLLRVIEWAKGADVANEILSHGLSKKHLENFETYYFEYATRVYLRDEFSFIKTREVFKNTDNKIDEIENNFKKDLDNLKGSDNWEDFLEDLKWFFESYKIKLLEVARDSNIDKEKLIKALDNDFDETYQNILSLSKQSSFLGRFYFNKKAINNPKKDYERIKKFKENYIDHALTLFNNAQKSHYVCYFCSNSHPEKYLSEFTEGDFAPISVSTDKFINLFYNGDVLQLQKCNICQIVILCAYAGFNKKSWHISDIEGTDYIFINLPDIKEAFRINNSLHAFLKNYQIGIITDNLYYKGAEIVITTLERRSRWLIDNIFFVEINPTLTKKSQKPKFTYFNIDRACAEVFLHKDKEVKIDSLLKHLAFHYELIDKKINISTEVIKRVLNKKSLKVIIFKYFKDYLNKTQQNESALWALISLEHLINQRRKGGNKMSISSTYGILNSIRKAGTESFQAEIDQEKRYHIAQRFLSLIRGGRKEDFYNELLRLYIVYEKHIPKQVFSLLSEDDLLTFQEKALAFLTGFVGSSKKQSEDKSNPEVEDEDA